MTRKDYLDLYSFCCLSLIGEIGHKCPCANKTEPKTRETGEKWCAKTDNNQVWERIKNENMKVDCSRLVQCEVLHLIARIASTPLLDKFVFLNPIQEDEEEGGEAEFQVIITTLIVYNLQLFSKHKI